MNIHDRRFYHAFLLRVKSRRRITKFACQRAFIYGEWLWRRLRQSKLMTARAHGSLLQEKPLSLDIVELSNCGRCSGHKASQQPCM